MPIMPNSIFLKTHKLCGGTIATYKVKSRELSIKKYWDVTEFYMKPALNISYPDAKRELESLLISAFCDRMVADVPVGMFLSGGYDSAAVAAIIQSSLDIKLKTFTIGFKGKFNEAPDAHKISDYLNTDHTEYYCSIDDKAKNIENLIYLFDEKSNQKSWMNHHP